MNLKTCIIHLDDLIVYSNTFEEHLERLDQILTRLKECDLKLALEKCFFFERVNFHFVSKDGIETDLFKIEKVRNWPTPSTPEELHSFLAFAGYYRRFINPFTAIGTAKAVPVIFGLFSIWTALAVSIIIIIIIIN
jgi:hypothetical protein